MINRANGDPSLFWRRVAPVALGVMMLTGCSDSNEPTTVVSDRPVAAAEKAERNRLFSIDYEFVDGRMARRTTANDGSLDVNGATTIGWCELNDLVEMTDVSNGSTEERSPNHPACDDRRLDPKDFGVKE